MTEQRIVASAESDAFRIIVHGSPPMDHGFRYWTEAPECPVAHDGGASVDEAVERTKDRIRTWCAHRTGTADDTTIEFVIEEAL